MFKKLIYISALLFVLIFLCSAGIFYYYYTHPDAVVSLIKGSISRSMNVKLDINHLSYSIRPLRILAKGVRLTPSRGSSGFLIEIPQLAGQFSFTGSFGRRTLVADTIELKGLLCTYNKADFRLAQKPTPPERLGGMLLNRGMALLLFRDFRIDAVKLTEGNITADLNGPIFKAESVSIFRKPNNRIEIESMARLQWPDKEIDLNIPELHVSTDHAISLSELTMKGAVSAKNMVLNSTDTKLTDVNLDAVGSLELNKKQLNIGQLKLSIGEHFSLLGTMDADYASQTIVKLIVESSESSPEYMKSLLPKRLKKTLPPLDVSGKVSIKGSLDLTKESDGWKWGYQLSSYLHQNRLAYRTRKEQFGGKISGNVGIRGSLSGYNISAEIEMSDSTFLKQGIQVLFPDIRFSVSGKHPVYHIKNGSLDISTISIQESEKPVRIKDIRLLTSNGMIDINQNIYRFSKNPNRVAIDRCAGGNVRSKEG